MGMCVSVVDARPSETQIERANRTPYRGSLSPSQSGMDAPAPAPELQALTDALAGRWTTREKVRTHRPDAERRNRPGRSGLAIRPGRIHVAGGVPLENTDGGAIRVWSHLVGPGKRPSTHVVHQRESWRVQMFPPPPRPGPKWNGKQLVLDTEVELAGTKYVWHEAIAVTSASSFTQTVDIGETGGAMRRWLTSDATKVTSQAQATRDKMGWDERAR